MMQVVVVRAFGGFLVGEVLRDEVEVARVLASEHADFVVRVVVGEGE